MNNPKISVVMPAYNAEKYISEAIESILNQTFKDFEFIIIDDGSADNSGNIIQKYAQGDSRIIAMKNEKNIGISETRNKLIALARGEYVVWQDADDISLPERIEKQVEFMNTHPEVGVCGGYLQLFNEEKNLGIRKYAQDDESLRKNIFRYNPVAQPAAIIRKKCFAELGMYDTSLSLTEDLEILFRIGTKYKFANIPEILIKYRQHPDSATFSKLREMETAALRIRKKYAGMDAYDMTIKDKIYNLFQFISVFIFPPKLKIRMFNFFRGS